jgi:HEPN domain-containing protein
MPDLKKAKKSIAEAAELCVKAGQIADFHARYVATRDADIKPKRAALGSLPKNFAPKLKEIDAALLAANKQAVAHDYLGAGQSLESVREKVAETASLKVAEKIYTDRLIELQAAVSDFAKNPGKKHPAIGPLIVKAEAALTEAGKKATTLKFTDAMTHLDEASVHCDSAAIKRTIRGGKAPPPNLENDLKALASKSGGTKALDEIVSELTEKDHPGFVLAALKARFDLESASKEGQESNKTTVIELQAMYTVMTKVPDSHTKDNPSFKRITRTKPYSGSAFDSDKKEITLGEGHPDASGPRPLAVPTELPEIDPKCQPNDATPAPKFFDWNTLHEVGHALDDKKAYMETNGKSDNHGGWESHGGDIMFVATAAEGEFGIKAAAIAKYLEDGTEPAPPPADWAKVKAWADDVRVGKDPWENGNKCTKKAADGGFIIRGRIFHEAYENSWVSYNPSARKQGLTGYQFRAPGEWFSELYAAYKSEKLKLAHPARKWLDKLFAEKKKKG